MADRNILLPVTVRDLADIVAETAAAGRRLEIRGGGSKAEIGALVRDAAILDLRAFAGVIDYDPAELVLTVGAGTPLAEVQALVAAERQMLAFEPFDHGPIFGRPAGAATIGGVVAAGVAGSNRLSMGAPRDHLLGFEAVSGRGEHFVAGGRVVKNVTGYDLPKLMAGSWGRLAAMTRLTLRLVPAGRTSATLILSGRSDAAAQAAMATAMRSTANVAAAAHLPAEVNAGRAVTAFRLHGFRPSVEARFAMLAGLLAAMGPVERLGEAEAGRLWRRLRDLSPLDDGQPLWRINVPPSGGCAVTSALAGQGARWLFDWAGGLVWLSFGGDAALVRRAAEAAGGHAMLVRAPAEHRALVPTLHPEAPGVAALSRRIRQAFDPAGVFETGRFPERPRAD
ncbi:FAD-linked oxidase [Sphingomonas oleivorans]|uniref:FAD-linked oxidase n=1 Tax=Sphingomonas oleivorans TaxID=1735121 RepID=A0A2T5FYH8_9SPHN|nr:FAD-binding protein [Sphingomonas oleivorans]PTQ11581.1 FAD-linked oxidase [Sphingomonas oleivorans]